MSYWSCGGRSVSMRTMPCSQSYGAAGGDGAMGRAFSPTRVIEPCTQGDAQGWDGGAPLALVLADWVCPRSLAIGVNSRFPAGMTEKKAKAEARILHFVQDDKWESKSRGKQQKQIPLRGMKKKGKSEDKGPDPSLRSG